MSEKKTVVQLEGISKFFPGVKALQDVSFDIREGEVHALCGENGAGKSTLIKVLTGAQPGDAGVIRIDGEPVEIKTPADAIQHGIACIYQELSIVPHLDVAKNLFLGQMFTNHGFINTKELYQNAEDILNNYIGLNVSPHAIAGGLSVGQQQMVEIGRAMARHARVVIMDEPTSSLSEAESDTLYKLIDMLRRDNVAIVYISHKLDEVMALSDRITVLRDGQYVTTLDAKETTQEELMGYMLGRNLGNMYDRSPVEQGEELLQVEHLTRKGVFDDISFSVKAGESLGFFGLVGAGRSEVMRAVYGVDRYDSGTVILNGKKLRRFSPSASISAGLGFATEDRKKEGLALRLSVMANLSIIAIKKFAHLFVINGKKQKATCNEYVESISIKTPSLSQLAGNLSGGNQQKVVLAKWLMADPKVLILDEPTRGIDVGSKAEFYSLIHGLAKQGLGMVVVSSEIEEIMGCCDRVIVIADGKMTADLPIEGTDSKQILTAAFGGEVS